MTQDSATPVPPVSGIDLSFRPRTYFGPLPLKTHLLARVTGHERRELLRRGLATGHGALPPELTFSTLDEDTRVAIGKIHPVLMGGEYLPPLHRNETEIARVSLASMTADQISLRAQLDRGCIHYRIVDEYENDYVQYECRPSETKLPLTLAELIGMIDTACEGGGAVMSHFIANIPLSGVSPRKLLGFVSVRSEFYPQLSTYYQRRMHAWFEANSPERPDQEG